MEYFGIRWWKTKVNDKNVTWKNKKDITTTVVNGTRRRLKILAEFSFISPRMATVVSITSVKARRNNFGQ